MRNDDVIKSVRYMLDINDSKIAEILKLAGYQPKRDEVAAIFENPNEEVDESGEYKVSSKKDTSDELMAHFLDGLIFYKRGKSDKHPPQPIQTPVTNNIVLKKLRVAFKLREEDIHEVLKSAGFSVSSPELNALFRSEDHRNYRECGDQLLRYFLKGLTLKYRDVP